MNRKRQRFCVWLMLCVVTSSGCTPVQPFFLHGTSGDLATYLDSATDIQYADIQHEPLDDVTGALRPRTVAHPEFDSIWDLTLEEAVATALQNSKVIRTFGPLPQFGSIVQNPPRLLSGSRGVQLGVPRTIYDVAIQESGQSGVSQALAQFDAVFNSNTTWDSTDRLQNLRGFTLGNDGRDQSNRVVINNEIVKRAATGSQFTIRNQTIHESIFDNADTRELDKLWFTAIETEVRQPLLRGAGTQVNRIPIVIARIRTDQAIADFEFLVREMMQNIETAYWELYFFYRNLNAAKLGRDSALSTWKRIYALSVEKAEGGEAQQEAQAREQYFFFRARVEEALRDLFRSETRLRYLMGLGATDGRLIRPADEPTRARVAFDWHEIHSESLTRSVELRRQHWTIKTRELELIAARNQLLPQLDVFGTYRWLGQGEKLLSTARPGGFVPGGPDDPLRRNLVPGSQAVDYLASGAFQEGQLGFQLSVPIGFRRELAEVRSRQLTLARARAVLEDMELEISHQLTDAMQNLEAQQMIAQTHYNRTVAAEAEVNAMTAAYDTGTVTLDRLLDAQRRRAESEIAYYQAIVEYNLAIIQVHFRKGSLLDYNGVMLAEGPWPGKAYSDAHERARRRAASKPMDYGYSRPRVISSGVVPQNPGSIEGMIDESLAPAAEGGAVQGEVRGEAVPDVNIFDDETNQPEALPLEPLEPMPLQQPSSEPADVPPTETLPVPAVNPSETEIKFQPTIRQPSRKISTTKRRSPVSRVSFIDDAPMTLRAKSSSTTKARRSNRKSNGSSDLDIRDPAQGQPKAEIRWK